MGKLSLTIIEPNDSETNYKSEELVVELDENLSIKELTSGLYNMGFMTDCKYGQWYLYERKEGDSYDKSRYLGTETSNETLFSVGVTNNSTLFFDGDTAAGDISDFQGAWNIIYPYLEQVGTIVGLAGATISFGIWLRNRFVNDSPKTISSLISDKNKWSARELATRLNLSEEQAKNMLKAFGYKWDKQHGLYCMTDSTKEILEKVNKAVKK